MNYIGDFAEDSTVRIALTTNDGNGGAVAPSSAFEVADFRVYKNGSATQKTSDNGMTITSPFDSVTGLHTLEIDTSNDTGDSGFWTTGADYWVIAVPDETVDSQTVVQVVASFSIQNRYMRGTDSAATSSQATAIETDTQDIQTRLPAALVSGRMDASVGAMASNTLTASALATDAVGEIADGVWDEPYAGHTTAGSFGKIMDLLRKANLTIDGTVSNAITPTTLTFSSNVSATTSAYAHAVLLFVSGPLAGENSPIVSYTSTNGVFVLEEPLTAAPSDGDEFIVIAGSHVHAIADIQSGLATTAQLTTVENKVDAIDDFVDTEVAAIKGVTDKLDTTVELDGAVYRFTTNALEQAPSGGGGSTVIVSPLQAVGPERVAGTEIVAYINDTSPIGPIAVTDADGVAIDLSALTLKVCIEKIDGTILANVTPSISGTDNNQVTFTPNADSVAKTGTFRWSLRKTSNNQVYALGDFIVDPAARISP